MARACTAAHVIASDYRRSQYVSLNWAKWPFFLDAFRAARRLLWIEADVLIMRNPFELLDGGEREKTLGDAIRYQGERAPCDANPSVAGGAVRRGVGAARGAAQLRAAVINSPHLAQTICDARPDNFTNGAFSQQHYANVHKVKYAHSERSEVAHPRRVLLVPLEHRPRRPRASATRAAS